MIAEIRGKIKPFLIKFLMTIYLINLPTRFPGLCQDQKMRAVYTHAQELRFIESLMYLLQHLANDFFLH
jgi:hypothetical protein